MDDGLDPLRVMYGQLREGVVCPDGNAHICLKCENVSLIHCIL